MSTARFNITERKDPVGDILKIGGMLLTEEDAIVNLQGDITVGGNICTTDGVFCSAKKAYLFAYLQTGQTELARTTAITTAGEINYITGMFENYPIADCCFSLGVVSGTTFTDVPYIEFTGDCASDFEIDWHATMQSDTQNNTISVGLVKHSATDDIDTVMAAGFLAGSDMTNRAKEADTSISLSGTMLTGLKKGDRITLVATASLISNLLTERFTTTISRKI